MGPLDILLVLLLILWAGWAIRHRKSCGGCSGTCSGRCSGCPHHGSCENQQPTKEADPRR